MTREEATNSSWVLLVATLEMIAAAALRTLAAPRTSAVTEEAARAPGEKGKTSLLSHLLFNYRFVAATQDTTRRHEINSRLSFEVWSLTLSCRGSEEVRVRVWSPLSKMESIVLLATWE